ncbi:MAG: vWA domain-containing protein, partial [Pseudomonadota bacterium]
MFRFFSHFSLPLTVLFAGALPPAAIAQAREPMVMEDKETLFRRVLVRDETERHDAPDGRPGPRLAPLQPLFVYAEDGNWIQAGLDDQGSDLFWVEMEKTVAWNQNIVATFEGSENVGRVLFFSNEDSVYDAVESEDPARTANDMRSAALEAEAGGAPSEDVVALGPRATPDLRENLYVMPILDSEEAVLESNGAFVNVLKVAVARAGQTATAETGLIEERVALPDVDRDAFRAGVVFVVDTTVSMEPYIRSTRDALEEVFIGTGTMDADAVSFGLIGYRDSLAAAPDLGYDVQTFVDLKAGSDPRAFLDGIARMTEAEATSRNFREDSYAAINTALTDLDWSPFGARYIVLVTDAGPREAGDEFSATRLTGRALNSLVKERLGAALAVMHLKTDQGANDHARAEAAYRDLANQPNQGALYFPIEDGDPDAYREAARRLSDLIVSQVGTFRGGEEEVAEGRNAIAEDEQIVGADRFTEALRSAGRTMQLAYLGREAGTEAPDVFEAYVADRDFDRPGLKPLSIRLLLSKTELSDLDEALKVIIRKGEDN